MQTIEKFLKEESGQGLVEYALIIALIALAAIVAIQALGGRIATMFQNTADQLPGGGE